MAEDKLKLNWLTKLFRSQPEPEPQLRVAESVYSNRHFHLAKAGTFTALCGQRVMNSGIPLSAWGAPSYLSEYWCPKCVALDKPKATQ
jgi:hypothetical protein